MYKPNKLRSDAMNALYKHHYDNNLPFSADVIEETELWKITTNKFPYDVIAREHHTLWAKDYSLGDLLIVAENKIKTNEYDCFFVNSQNKMSIPEIPHIHLLKLL